MSKFDGFSLPEGTFLPPEFSQLLPELRTLGEVKVLLVILSEYLKAGLDARPLSHDEIQELAGLSRGTVNAALQRLRSPLQCIKRIGAPGGGYRYEPRLRQSLESLKFRLPMHESWNHDHDHDQTALLDDMHGVVNLLNEKCGVSLRVAQDIVARYDLDVVRRHCEYALCAAEQGLIRKTLAAYVVASIRDNWGPPLGWKERGKGKERWFTDEEYEKFFKKPGET